VIAPQILPAPTLKVIRSLGVWHFRSVHGMTENTRLAMQCRPDDASIMYPSPVIVGTDTALLVSMHSSKTRSPVVLVIRRVTVSS